MVRIAIEDRIGSKFKLTTNGADRSGRIGEAHILKTAIGVVSVDAGWVHQIRGLAGLESEMLEGGLHCRFEMRVWWGRASRKGVRLRR